jgi:hypothetical protein
MSSLFSIRSTMSSSVTISYNKFAHFDNPFSLSQTGPMLAVADFAPEYLSEIGRTIRKIA